MQLDQVTSARHMITRKIRRKSAHIKSNLIRKKVLDSAILPHRRIQKKYTTILSTSSLVNIPQLHIKYALFIQYPPWKLAPVIPLSDSRDSKTRRGFTIGEVGIYQNGARFNCVKIKLGLRVASIFVRTGLTDLFVGLVAG